MRQHLPFNDDFRRCGYFQVHRLTLDQGDRGTLKRTCNIRLIHIRRQHHATDERNDGLPADRHRDGHGFIHRFIFLVHLADVLLHWEQAAQCVSVVNHQPIHAPVDPRAIGILGNYGVPSSNITSPIPPVDQWDRKLKHVDGIAQVDILFARSGFDRHRRDEFFFAFQIGRHDVFGRRGWRHVHCKCGPGK